MAVILLHTIHVQGSEIGMWEYLRNSREVSTFYEDYYVDPDNTTVTFPDKKNNLIYIFMESMDRMQKNYCHTKFYYNFTPSWNFFL